MQLPADNISHSLDLATGVGTIERLRVLHTDSLSVSCLKKRRHAIIAIVRV